MRQRHSRSSFVFARWQQRFATAHFGQWFNTQNLPSLSFPVRGAGHRPNPFHVAPEASRIGCEGVSWPGVPPGVIMGRTLEHQMLDRLPFS